MSKSRRGCEEQSLRLRYCQLNLTPLFTASWWSAPAMNNRGWAALPLVLPVQIMVLQPTFRHFESPQRFHLLLKVVAMPPTLPGSPRVPRAFLPISTPPNLLPHMPTSAFLFANRTATSSFLSSPTRTTELVLLDWRKRDCSRGGAASGQNFSNSLKLAVNGSARAPPSTTDASFPAVLMPPSPTLLAILPV